MCIFVCISFNSMRFYSKESGNDANWMGTLTYFSAFSAIYVSTLSDDCFFCAEKRATKCTFEQWLSRGFKKTQTDDIAMKQKASRQYHANVNIVFVWVVFILCAFFI